MLVRGWQLQRGPVCVCVRSCVCVRAEGESVQGLGIRV